MWNEIKDFAVPELEQVAETNGWVDVCKETEN